MKKKIKVDEMDDVDRQQQEDIDSARTLAYGALLACVTISVVQLGAFIFALYEMGRAIDVLKIALGK